MKPLLPYEYIEQIIELDQHEQTLDRVSQRATLPDHKVFAGNIREGIQSLRSFYAGQAIRFSNSAMLTLLNSHPSCLSREQNDAMLHIVREYERLDALFENHVNFYYPEISPDLRDQVLQTPPLLYALLIEDLESCVNDGVPLP